MFSKNFFVMFTISTAFWILFGISFSLNDYEPHLVRKIIDIASAVMFLVVCLLGCVYGYRRHNMMYVLEGCSYLFLFAPYAADHDIKLEGRLALYVICLVLQVGRLQEANIVFTEIERYSTWNYAFLRTTKMIFREKLGILRKLSELHRIPYDIFSRVIRQLEFEYAMQEHIKQNDVINSMPRSLRQSIKERVYVSLMNSSLFVGVSHVVLSEMIFSELQNDIDTGIVKGTLDDFFTISDAIEYGDRALSRRLIRRGFKSETCIRESTAL